MGVSLVSTLGAYYLTGPRIRTIAVTSAWRSSANNDIFAAANRGREVLSSTAEEEEEGGGAADKDDSWTG
jgi:hypothetical protein